MLEAYIIGALATAVTLGVAIPEPNNAQTPLALLYAVLWPLFWALLAGSVFASVALVIWEKLRD